MRLDELPRDFNTLTKVCAAYLFALEIYSYV